MKLIMLIPGSDFLTLGSGSVFFRELNPDPVKQIILVNNNKQQQKNRTWLRNGKERKEKLKQNVMGNFIMSDPGCFSRVRFGSGCSLRSDRCRYFGSAIVIF